MEQKKFYVKPEQAEVKMNMNQTILTASGDNWAREYQSGLEDED